MGLDDWTAVVQDHFRSEEPLDVKTVWLGRRQLSLPVARTPQQWARGLAGQPDVEAMLFVMPPGSQFPFQMKGVGRDLLIAFFDDDGKVVDLGFLEAHVGFKHAASPYTYALELQADLEDYLILRDIADGLTVE